VCIVYNNQVAYGAGSFINDAWGMLVFSNQ